ncbi:Tat pathway signal sequence domain protein [Microbacterium panaciterrae]|uniref:Tat pathway signal sequence domain protein n=1 Tax=Microbacterium panaciterrae TaxID=985759 RepID=A0ABP8PIX8_9MICO
MTGTAPAARSIVAGEAVPALELRWLDGAPPVALPAGCTWGTPLQRGTLTDIARLRLRAVDGGTEPAQFWPLATWPDGSLKWVGAAIGARSQPAEYELVITEPRAESGEREDDDPRGRVHQEENAGDGPVVIVSDRLRVTFGEAGGEALVRGIRHGASVIARDVRLVSLRQEGIDELGGVRVPAASVVDEVVVEQAGPVRAVVKVTGHHREPSSRREWLPFTVRFVIVAGSDQIRIVHSFIWDGDAERDFLAGLGLTATVPLRSPVHDRHVRLAGAGGGLFSEAVRGITGLRRDPGAEIRAAQIRGEVLPSSDRWDHRVSARLELIPAWNDFSLSQLSADGFTLRKRTRAGHAWIDAGAGTRSEGYVAVTDAATGGLGIGVRSFWQSFPGRLDVRDAAGSDATVTTWLHAPDAAPMDMRFYHDGLGQDDFETQLEGLEITYEDYEPGFGDAHGIARTHELTLFAYGATPAVERVAVEVAALQNPPLLQPTIAQVEAAGVFGDWSPVDRSTPLRADIEDSIDFLLEFYLGQVDQRRWYGFWNYGDVMHAYDADRHVWRYDVGGYAWDNSELSPDLWLWTSYLRTGRADVFRLAEAMTRHTGEVDVYHLGRWAGLGSRHNVQHWGCSAKQLRISSPAYRRYFHYLTADERVGDLLTELRDSDRRFLDTDPTRKVRTDAATYRPDPDALAVGLGTDWGALAATWLADWERTGNERSRDRLLGTMADIGALPHGFLTGEALYDLEAGRFDTSRDRIAVSHLSAVFGLVEIVSELLSLVEVPGFRDAWLDYCRLYLATPEEQTAAVGAPLEGIHLEQAHSRLTAFVAAHTDDPEQAAAQAERAWAAFEGAGEWLVHRRDFRAERIRPPFVLNAVDEAPTVSTNDAAQYGLAAIQNLALIGQYLPHGEAGA